MAKFVCDSGTLTLSGTDFSDVGDLCISNVTVDITVSTVSYACMGDSSWQSNDAGTKSVTFTFDTALDDTLGVDLDATIGATSTLSFDTVDGKIYAGSVIITAINISAPVDDYATVSWTATADGAITEVAS